MKSAIRISALLWADILVLYALFEMQDYLTDVWGLSFTHAAGILNIWNGISKVLQPLFLFLVGNFLGNFGMLVVSSSAYTIGIWFLFMSTPPILANSTGTCKKYEEQCIGETQKALLYTGMALIAVGVAGNTVSVKSFLREQPHTHDYGAVIGCLKVPGMFMVAIVGVAGAIALPYIKLWTFRFGIPAVCTAIATVSFLTGLCCYKYEILGPKGSQVPSFFRMLTLRIWLTFIVCGIVSSIGNTYFVEQAKHLDRHLGKWEVPTQVLLFAQTWLGKLLGYVAGWFLTGPAYGVVMAKTFSVLCCITAARMEVKRLGVVRSHGLLDRPDEDVPMSVYWLLFQFVLLGGLDSLLEKNVGEFHEDETIDEPEKQPEKQALQILITGVTGIGHMLGVLSVYVVGRVSGEVDKQSWFQFTLNRSRLDRYYWVLAVLSSVSLIVFVVVRACCMCRNR